MTSLEHMSYLVDCDISNISVRDGTSQHCFSPARPEATRNRPAQSVYVKPKIIFRPGLARNIT